MKCHNRQTGLRRSLTALILSASGMWTGAVADPAADFSEYLSEVDDGVYLAGSIDLQALRNKSTGPIRVIDLRTAAEGSQEEAAAAESLGLDYTNIPVSSATVDPAQVDALRETLDTLAPETLVVVHCATGNRAGMLWGAAQLADGVPLDQVQSKVSTIMTKQPVIDGLQAYAKTLDAGL